ncbi:exported protein of unknown function (plasmid) [Cardinium endosymbiont cEper1 of Encarsia pergandiella]|uniref:hypothetical protein n=1 Tax=Cardinium endosymbiont of Encarsia pergandiella TaxID=249402 RepID=UPI00027E9E1C|nr:hypothetical protein [Cardinium endosymbiont of Encarsia pergandiella]CCM10648.1 exported protein of unknown function [Cardinium endosymbiont cEper1 of Encarsia pergandiella]
MNKLKNVLHIVLLLSFFNPVFGKSNHFYQPLKSVHSNGCHCLEVRYGIWKKMHGVKAGYVCHFNETWYMKLSGGFSNKKLLSFSSTIYYNIYSNHESIYFGILFGPQVSYQFKYNNWLVKNKKFNAGIQLGIEYEKVLTEYLSLIVLPETTISILDKNNIFNYYLSTGIRVNF